MLVERSSNFVLFVGCLEATWNVENIRRIREYKIVEMQKIPSILEIFCNTNPRF